MNFRAFQKAIGMSSASVFALQVAGCSTVPPLYDVTNNLPFGTEITVDDIVQRVRCELADALDKKTQEDPFKWMQSWTVKADLTLQVNETSGLTPSATLVEPFHNAYSFKMGPSSVAFPNGNPGNVLAATVQNFNLGLGATYSGQVFRTETVSFALSLSELKKWREEGNGKNLSCLPVGVTDLQGSLDLAPWIESALGPVAAGDLTLGNHPAPGSGPPQKPAGGAAAAFVELDAKIKAKLSYYAAVIKNSADNATKSAQLANATRRESETILFLSRSVKDQISSLAYNASKQAINATLAQQYVNTETIKAVTPDTAASFERTANLDAVGAAKNAEAAAQNAALANLLEHPNPPIESLSHTVNFIVTYGATVSPNWVLLHWKGPANVGNLASASGIRTHTLTIALGSPAAIPNSETNRVLNNEAFRQAIQSP